MTLNDPRCGLDLARMWHATVDPACRPSMRTTGGLVTRGRSGMSDVRIGLDGYGCRRRGCCTLVLHPGTLTLKCQHAQTHGSGSGRPLIALAGLTPRQGGVSSTSGPQPDGPLLPSTPVVAAIGGSGSHVTSVSVRAEPAVDLTQLGTRGGPTRYRTAPLGLCYRAFRSGGCAGCLRL